MAGYRLFEWGYGIEGIDEVRKRHSGDISALDRIKGFYKESSYYCSFEEVTYLGEQRFYVGCRLGRDLASHYAPVLAIEDPKEDFEEVTLKRYLHNKYKPTLAYSVNDFTPYEYNTLQGIEFLSDLDPQEKRSKDEVEKFIENEVKGAFEFYESVTKSLGKEERECYKSIYDGDFT